MIIITFLYSVGCYYSSFAQYGIVTDSQTTDYIFNVSFNRVENYGLGILSDFGG